MTICEFETTFKVNRVSTDSWKCQQESKKNSRYCIWHAPPEEKTVEELIETQQEIDSNEIWFPDFSGLNFAEKDLTDWQFKYANFDKANLSHANLGGASFDHSSFIDGKLEGANLSNTRLNAVDFENSDLRWVDLRGAMVAFSNFGDADLRNIEYDEFEPCFFSGARLDEGKTPTDFMERQVDDLPDKAIETLPGPAWENYEKARQRRIEEILGFFYGFGSNIERILASFATTHWTYKVYKYIKKREDKEEAEPDGIPNSREKRPESQTELSDYNENKN